MAPLKTLRKTQCVQHVYPFQTQGSIFQAPCTLCWADGLLLEVVHAEAQTEGSAATCCVMNYCFIQHLLEVMLQFPI